MSEQTLRDRRGTVIGSIKEANGKLVLRDARGTIRGEYDPRTNQTRNDRGTVIGSGNLLGTLLND